MLSLVHHFNILKNKILVSSVYLIISLTLFFLRFKTLAFLNSIPLSLAPATFYSSSPCKLRNILLFLHRSSSALNFSNPFYNTIFFDSFICFWLSTQHTYFIILSPPKWRMNALDPLSFLVLLWKSKVFWWKSKVKNISCSSSKSKVTKNQLGLLNFSSTLKKTVFKNVYFSSVSEINSNNFLFLHLQ